MEYTLQAENVKKGAIMRITVQKIVSLGEIHRFCGCKLHFFPLMMITMKQSNVWLLISDGCLLKTSLRIQSNLS